jgi:hypothetical protein
MYTYIINYQCNENQKISLGQLQASSWSFVHEKAEKALRKYHMIGIIKEHSNYLV